ncbi:MAG: NUDIX hydrolase [Candidatus Limnocylindrales bacterium]
MARLSGSARLSRRTTRATSAGGIVIRVDDGRRQIVLGRRRRERDPATWTLPKGTPDPGEQTEETALREVTEETGLEVAILERVGDVEYWFMQTGTRIHKIVHYFLMAPTGGSLERHDHEFDEVRWVDLAEADQLMSHDSERRVVADSSAAIERHFPVPVGTPSLRAGPSA